MNRGILNFLNQLDEGKRGKSNSFAERVANFLTPNDEFEYRNGLLSNMDGSSAMNRMGEKTSYGTLGQANYAGNDPSTPAGYHMMPDGSMMADSEMSKGSSMPYGAQPDQPIQMSKILPAEIIRAIENSDFPDKQGFAVYLSQKFNEYPDGYDMIMSQPDALVSAYQAYEIGKTAGRALA